VLHSDEIDFLPADWELLDRSGQFRLKCSVYTQTLDLVMSITFLSVIHCAHLQFRNVYTLIAQMNVYNDGHYAIASVKVILH
jgi:hypothetical protein